MTEKKWNQVYEVPVTREFEMSSEGMLCVSQWNVEQDNMMYEKYEW